MSRRACYSTRRLFVSHINTILPRNKSWFKSLSKLFRNSISQPPIYKPIIVLRLTFGPSLQTKQLLNWRWDWLYTNVLYSNKYVNHFSVWLYTNVLYSNKYVNHFSVQKRWQFENAIVFGNLEGVWNSIIRKHFFPD